MPAYALFLRGINVGGNKKVSMSELRALIEQQGFTDPATLLMSGNAVFRGAAVAVPALEKRFENAIAKHFGFEVHCVARTAKEWPALVAANPFRTESQRDPAHLLLVLLKRDPAAGAIAKLRAAIKGRERVELARRELYAVYPDGIGTSKLTLPVIERCLGTVGTGRNWNTVLKVAALLED